MVNDTRLLLRLDAILGLLAVIAVLLGFNLILLDTTLGAIGFLVALLVGLVAARSYVRLYGDRR